MRRIWKLDPNTNKFVSVRMYQLKEGDTFKMECKSGSKMFIYAVANSMPECIDGEWNISATGQFIDSDFKDVPQDVGFAEYESGHGSK